MVGCGLRSGANVRLGLAAAGLGAGIYGAGHDEPCIASFGSNSFKIEHGNCLP